MRRMFLGSLGLVLASTVAATEIPDSVPLTLPTPGADAEMVREECARCVRVSFDDEPEYGECVESRGSRTICWEIHDPQYDIYTCDTIELVPGQECEGGHHHEDEDSVTDVTDADVIYAPEGAIVGAIWPCSTSNPAVQS